MVTDDRQIDPGGFMVPEEYARHVNGLAQELLDAALARGATPRLPPSRRARAARALGEARRRIRAAARVLAHGDAEDVCGGDW